MSYTKLHLENVTIPADAKDIALQKREWKCEGAPDILVCIWHYSGGLPGFIDWSNDNEDGYKYGLTLRTVGKAMRGVRETIKSHNPEYDLADYLCEKLDDYPEMVELDHRTGYYALTHGDHTFLWMKEEACFSAFLASISDILRKADKGPNQELDKLVAEALADKSKLDKLTGKLAQTSRELDDYAALFDHTDKLLGKWGLGKETLPLIAYCCLPQNKEGLRRLCAAHGLPGALREAGLYEEMFFELQQKASHLYSLSFRGYPTKEFLTATALALAESLKVLEYGVYPNSLATLVRVFENASVEGIHLDMYKADSAYDPEDFGYYDSIENETVYDKLWAEIDLAPLLQQ